MRRVLLVIFTQRSDQSEFETRVEHDGSGTIAQQRLEAHRQALGEHAGRKVMERRSAFEREWGAGVGDVDGAEGSSQSERSHDSLLEIHILRTPDGIPIGDPK